jgi:hypothetical protein
LVTPLSTQSPTPSSTPVLSPTPSASSSPSTLNQPFITEYFHVYPNPCHLSKDPVSFVYVLYEPAEVQLTIHSYLGDTLLQRKWSNQIGQQNGTRHIWEWDGRNQQGHLLRTGGYIAIIIIRNKNNDNQQRMMTKFMVVR